MGTIINNTLVSDETKLRIAEPFYYVPDPDKGEALGLAYLYFGEEGTDPALPENQKRVYALQEDGSAIPISQPVRTTAGGVPEYNGSQVSLAISGAYSLKVLSSELEQKYYYPSIENNTGLTVGFGGVIEDVITLGAGQVVVQFPRVDLAQSIIDIDGETIDSRSLFKDIDYTITDGANGELTLTVSYPSGTLIRARQNVTTSQENRLDSVSRLFAFNTLSDALTVDFQLGDMCTVMGQSVANDGLGGSRYDVVAGGTGTNDGVTFINLDNGLQLRLLAGRYKLKAYTEEVAQASVLAGVLTIDANQGSVQEVTLTENVSSIVIGNVVSGVSTTVQLSIKQDGTGSRSVDFSGYLTAGGVAPSLSTDPDAEDIFVFQTKNGTDWYLFSAGLDFKAV